MPRKLEAIINDLSKNRSTFNKLATERAHLEAIENRSDGETERLGNINAGELRLAQEHTALQKEFRALDIDPDALESGDGSPVRPFGVGPARVSRGRPGVLASAIEASGFDLRSRPSVRIAAKEIFAAWTFPGTVDLPGRTLPDIAGKVQDRRFLFPFVAQEDLGLDLSVTDYQQTVETVAGAVERDPSSGVAKATLDGTVAAVVAAVKQVALTAVDVPNAVIESLPAFGDWLDGQLSQRIGRAVDAHIHAQIVAKTPATTSQGLDPLFDTLRKAVTSMRGAGANPQIAAMNPVQAEALDLTRTADGVYLGGMASAAAGPFWDLTVIESPSIPVLSASAGPLVIDPGLLGLLYTGPTDFRADPFSKMKNNQTDFLLEMNLLFHVRDITGAREIRA